MYFEKLRIKEGKPKSKKREEMEEMHCKDGGLDIKNALNRVICMRGERPSIDSYGRLSIIGPGGQRMY